MTRVIAPHNGAAFRGELGFMTAAFDEEPIVPYGWNPPYYADYVSASGYSPTYPLWIYRIDFSSAKYRAAAQRVADSKVARVRPISKKRWESDVETLGQILNKVFEDEWEWHPFTTQEYSEFWAVLKPMVEPSQMLIAEVDGKSVGVCAGFPDLNPLVRPFKGKSGPVQMIKLLLGAGRYKRAGVYAIGVLPEYRGTGLAQALAITVYRLYEKHGLKDAFYYFVNESNTRSRRFAESIGGTGRVLYHCYDKRLS